jgi:glutamate-5-semialdehyde dehydrogenase
MDTVVKQAERARVAATALATATRRAKDDTLDAMAGALLAGTKEILAANEDDLAA